MEEIVALDLFAGTGWGVACKWLGIKEKGVELMAEAVATREANGMETIYRDVWDGLLLSRAEHARLYGLYTMLIGSPPCQTFSVAGGGAGRRALDEVIEAIQMHAYKDPELLREFGEKHDMRTALVLSPLAYIYRDMPRLVVLEQVPTVLPVWEAYAEIMTDLGYDVKTAILNAEQYGVPQTRRRAILVARLDGPVKLPTPTHSRYYPRDPKRSDPGVLPWVSMAQALGWGRTVPSPTYCNSGHGGAGIEWGGNSVRKSMREQSLTGQSWVKKDGVAEGTNDAIRVTVEDAAAIQSYPVVFRNGNQTNAAKRTPDQPAPTIHFGARSNKVEWMDPELAADPTASGDRVTVEEAAALQSYPELRPEVAAWKWVDAPATTVQGDPRITAREHRYHGEQNGTSLRLTVEEAHVLQTYPVGRGLADRPSPTITGGGTETGGAEPIAKWHERYTGAPGWIGSTDRLSTGEAATLQSYEKPFEFCGSKTKQYLQIGNAVPPLLACAVLSALTEESQAPKRRRRTTRKLV